MGKNEESGVAEKVRKDQFLEVLLGKPVYSVRYDLSMPPGSLKEGDDCFLYSKVPSSESRTLEEFQNHGFRVVELNLQLERTTSPPAVHGSAAPSATVRWAKSEDRAQVSEIAGNSFRQTRFHLDPLITNATADRIKAVWAENFFLGKRGDGMIVSTIEGKVAGFILIIEDGDSACLDLVAVSTDHQKKGIASMMIEFALKELAHREKVLVGTQASNIPSIRTYEKMGFRTFSTSFVLHYHGSFDPGVFS